MRNFFGIISVFLMSLIIGVAMYPGDSDAAKPIRTTGTISGKVLIAGTNSAIAGATVTADGSAGVYIVTADSRGKYTIKALAGVYDVTATADGYNSQTFSVDLRAGLKVTLNFALNEAVASAGELTGAVTDAGTGVVVSGALVSTDTGDYSDVTDNSGVYIITGVTAGPYIVTATADGYVAASSPTDVVAEATTTVDFALDASQTGGLAITSLTASLDSFVEAAAVTVNLTAVIDGTPASYEWSQVSGPKAPLASVSATSAVVDVSTLAVAAEVEMVFRLTLDGTLSEDVTVSVQPADMLAFLGQNVQIGGSSTAVARFQYAGAEWCLFNLGTELRATPVQTTKGAVYSLTLPEFAYGIEIVGTNALVATGSAGITVVDIADPAAMAIKGSTPVSYYLDNITFTETGGSILYGNIKESNAAPIVDIVSDGTNVYIADVDYGIHKTTVANVLSKAAAGSQLDPEQEVPTVQYAGEHSWGGPISLRLFGGKLFAAMGVQGLGIFDPLSLDQIGRYNLYTDEARTEDYFGAMAVTQAVSSDPVTGDLFLDDFTGLPDYRQVNFEITVVMKGTGTDDPTPWADMERDGKWFYEALDLDVAQMGGRTIAYVAYSLGGAVAVDVTGFESASAGNFLNAPYLGFFPAVPVNGPYDTGSMPSSLLPYEGAGKLKESGVTGVEVNGNQVFLTDHFAGLVILGNAATPDTSWGDAPGSFNNDTDGIADNNVPDYEDITVYDMSPWDPADNESLPQSFYDAPSLLATRELKGHGYTLTLMDSPDIYSAGGVDVLGCSGAGGFVFVDVTDVTAEKVLDRFAILVYFPTTDEIGAAVDGSATQTIAIGHAAGVAVSDNYLYVSDGPHGISAWKITDDLGYPTDVVHLVGNTLQNEYPVNDIYPASHTVNNVIDFARGKTWALCVGNGLRRVPIDQVEAGVGVVGAPLLMELFQTDSFEHNADWGALKSFPYQDQAYDVEFIGNYAYVADGTNGLTIYDVTKNPTSRNSGYFVGNIGYNQGEPLLGTASGVELWTDAATGKIYAVIACGPYGVGVVDVTDINALKLVKVFEPIKYENGDVGMADGQAIDVEVIGDNAYFTYDSFGVLCYSMADLTAPVPDGVDPTELFKKEADGTVVYDYRPEFLGRFKLQWVEGYETMAGGAVRMAYTEQAGQLNLYVAFHEAGVVKINYTDPANPVLVDLHDTASEAVDVAIANGRLYVADGTGGLVFLK